MKLFKTKRKGKACKFILKFNFYLTILCLLLISGIVKSQVDFRLKYKDKGHCPSWDPDGDALTTIMEAATEHWASFYPGASHRVKITYYWDDHSGGIGLSPFDITWDDLAVTRRRAGKIFTPNGYRIRFYTVEEISSTTGITEFKWHVDKNPTENSEFQMEPYLFATAGSSGPYYTGTPDDFLEVGFTGNTRNSDADGMDLLTVALHEIGHTLGLGFRKKREVKRDGDYDIPPGYPLGDFGVMGLLDSKDIVDPGHLADSKCLMGPGISSDMRKLPTETDILVIAIINNYPDTSVEFPRTYTGSGVTSSGSGIAWTDPTNWHEYTPTLSKSFGIIDMGNPNVYMVTNGEAQNAFIDKTGLLQINDQALAITYDLEMKEYSRIEITSGSISSNNIFHNGEIIEVSNSGSISVSNLLEVNTGGIVSVMGNRSKYAEIIAPEATINLNNAELSVINVEGDIDALNSNGIASVIHGGNSIIDSLHRFHNDGTVRAENGDLFFNFSSWPDNVFDLDGDEYSTGREYGEVDALDGSVEFSIGPSEEFNGKIDIGINRSVKFGTEITIGNNGTVSLDDSDFSSPEITVKDGGKVSVSSMITRPSRFQGNQIWINSGYAEVAASGVLKIYGETTFKGGLIFTGYGSIVQNGDITVDSETVSEVNISNFDWNGDITGSSTDITIEAGSHLIIYSSHKPPFEGNIIIEEDGILEITSDWQLNGNLELNGGIIRGGDIDNYGEIIGWGTIDAEITGPGAVIETGSGIDGYP